MAICAYSKYDLIENIFASRPEDFIKYGIYTCRFYVDGGWVEVITDTNIPCLRDNSTGVFAPIYGSSANPDELWIPFVEKAFAKAMGSYEGIPNIKVQKALLHLTGGSVQQTNLREEVARHDGISDLVAWNEFKKRLERESIVILIPAEKLETTTTEVAAVDTAALIEGNTDNRQAEIDNCFIPNKLYSVILCRDLGGYELVLMHNPWKNARYSWSGEWSDVSNDWDLYPELQVEIEKDPSIPWRRNNPNGYFWISFRNVIKYFNTTFTCKLFPSEKFNFYCVRGECRGRHAGGPLTTIRDRESVLRDAHASRAHALQKVTDYLSLDVLIADVLCTLVRPQPQWWWMATRHGSTIRSFGCSARAAGPRLCTCRWYLWKVATSPATTSITSNNSTTLAIPCS